MYAVATGIYLSVASAEDDPVGCIVALPNGNAVETVVVNVVVHSRESGVKISAICAVAREIATVLALDLGRGYEDCFNEESEGQKQCFVILNY